MSCMSFLMSQISTFISQTNSARWLGVIAVTTALFSSACGGEGPGSPPVSPPTPPQPTGPGAPAISETGGIPAGFRLVWSDEFADAGLPDATKWNYDTERNAAGWYNNELQYYGNARLENSSVANGLLTITARREDLSTGGLPDWGGQRYSSARLITRDKASWTYGFIEVRAKLPCGVGTWPAIWLLGDSDIPWPASGEIDMMEQVGSQPDEITGTIHTTSTAGTSGDGNLTIMDDVCEVFHNYQLTWTAEQL